MSEYWFDEKLNYLESEDEHVKDMLSYCSSYFGNPSVGTVSVIGKAYITNKNLRMIGVTISVNTKLGGSAIKPSLLPSYPLDSIRGVKIPLSNISKIKKRKALLFFGPVLKIEMKFQTGQKQDFNKLTILAPIVGKQKQDLGSFYKLLAK